MTPPLLGAHVSAAGGLPRAVPRAAELGCEAIQVFVKSPHQWALRRLGAAETRAFRQAVDASPIAAVVAHATYLINLAARDPTILERSRETLARELDRSAELALDALIVHPGSHLGAGVEAGLATVARSLERVLAGRRDSPTRLLLETTAGQGTTLGRELGELARLLDLTGRPPALGVCLDTCHLFAAGYRIHDERGYRAFVEELDERLGPGVVACVHLNDSVHPCGSARDRHANLGDGQIGRAAFGRLLADPRFAGLPLILETPAGEQRAGHVRDLALLKSLRRRRSPPAHSSRSASDGGTRAIRDPG